VEFEWDDTKARDNLLRHGVSFDVASTVFDDPVGAGYWRKGKEFYEKANRLHR